MRIGPAIRRAFGPLEPALANAYRRAFFDIRKFARLVEQCSPDRILEVGCGEGAIAQAVTASVRGAHYVGIDISPRAGRLFHGDRSRVEFRVTAVEPFVAQHSGAFDVVLMCDVLHHVPPALRPQFLDAAASAVRPGGVLLLKEWERRPNALHLAVWFSDRVITGDSIRFETAESLRSLLARTLPGFSPFSEHRLPPWRNNIVFLLSRN